MNSVVIADLDNTIYNWVDFYAPAFRAMVHVLAPETGVPEQELIQQFKQVYARWGSVEFAFSVQELDVCRGLPDTRVEELVTLAWGAFRRVRDHHLRLYEGVKETLQWAERHRIMIVGLTNAPIIQAERRLRLLRIDHLFGGIAGYKRYEVPNNLSITREIRDREKSGYRFSSISRRWELELEELKPSTLGYERIMCDLSAQGSWTVAIGDSINKDLAPAMKLGAVGVWAKYGTIHEEANLSTLLAITHWTEDRIADTYDYAALVPDYTIDSFAQLRSIVHQPQPSFEGFDP